MRLRRAADRSGVGVYLASSPTGERIAVAKLFDDTASLHRELAYVDRVRQSLGSGAVRVTEVLGAGKIEGPNGSVKGVLVTDYASGEALQGKIEAAVRVPAQLHTLSQSFKVRGRALAEMHISTSQKAPLAVFVHGDPIPDNLLVEGGRTTIVDFSNAHLFYRDGRPAGTAKAFNSGQKRLKLEK